MGSWMGTVGKEATWLSGGHWHLESSTHVNIWPHLGVLCRVFFKICPILDLRDQLLRLWMEQVHLQVGGPWFYSTLGSGPPPECLPHPPSLCSCILKSFASWVSFWPFPLLCCGCASAAQGSAARCARAGTRLVGGGDGEGFTCEG